MGEGGQVGQSRPQCRLRVLLHLVDMAVYKRQSMEAQIISDVVMPPELASLSQC